MLPKIQLKAILFVQKHCITLLSEIVE